MSDGGVIGCDQATPTVSAMSAACSRTEWIARFTRRGGLGGDTEIFADLAVRALAAVAEAKALLHGVLGAGIEDVEQPGDHLHFGIRHDLDLGAGVGVGEEIDEFVGVVVADGAVEAGRGGQPMQACVLVVEFVAVTRHGAQCGTEAGGTVAGEADKRGLLIEARPMAWRIQKVA